MWLIASFDLPSTGHEAAKRYRRLRKVLISSGFSFVQKSVAWRWCENHEHCDGIIAKVLKPLSVNGDMLFFFDPRLSFQEYNARLRRECSSSAGRPAAVDDFCLISDRNGDILLIKYQKTVMCFGI